MRAKQYNQTDPCRPITGWNSAKKRERETFGIKKAPLLSRAAVERLIIKTKLQNSLKYGNSKWNKDLF